MPARWVCSGILIADGLVRQLPHLAARTVRLKRGKTVHTKTPFFLLTTVGKRGLMFIVPDELKLRPNTCKALYGLRLTLGKAPVEGPFARGGSP